MLRRIAESLFWIGRYIERADDQARVLTTYVEHTTDADSTTFSADLCHAMGTPVEETVDPDETWSRLGIDPESPQSMVSALNNCRDSTRRAREILATPTWEAINRSHRMAASGRLSLMRPALACREVHDSCSTVIGTLHATMPRDQAWHFLNAGRFDRAYRHDRPHHPCHCRGPGPAGAPPPAVAGLRRPAVLRRDPWQR